MQSENEARISPIAYIRQPRTGLCPSDAFARLARGDVWRNQNESPGKRAASATAGSTSMRWAKSRTSLLILYHYAR
jgi:hypothetical protein